MRATIMRASTGDRKVELIKQVNDGIEEYVVQHHNGDDCTNLITYGSDLELAIERFDADTLDLLKDTKIPDMLKLESESDLSNEECDDDSPHIHCSKCNREIDPETGSFTHDNDGNIYCYDCNQDRDVRCCKCGEVLRPGSIAFYEGFHLEECTDHGY